MATTLRDDLRAALTDALRRRDRRAVTVCRTALAAIDNAEAVDVGALPPAGAAEASARGVGAADLPRRLLSEAAVRAVLEAEVAERRAAVQASDDAPWRREREEELRLLQSFLR